MNIDSFFHNSLSDEQPLIDLDPFPFFTRAFHSSWIEIASSHNNNRVYHDQQDQKEDRND